MNPRLGQRSAVHYPAVRPLRPQTGLGSARTPQSVPQHMVQFVARSRHFPCVMNDILIRRETQLVWTSRHAIFLFWCRYGNCSAITYATSKRICCFPKGDLLADCSAILPLMLLVVSPFFSLSAPPPPSLPLSPSLCSLPHLVS
jgi:hypothetical protein